MKRWHGGGNTPAEAGKTCISRLDRDNVRNTPAEAGKTQRGVGQELRPQKHPRRGGEDNHELHYNTKSKETPPPRRGRRREAWLADMVRGNTPAEAGKTLKKQLEDMRCRKHPRRGGEDLIHIKEKTPWRETPPPRRGRHDLSHRPIEALGNTPAEAGKTSTFKEPPTGRWKHPRRGGEDFGWYLSSFAHQETPPPRRGRPVATPGRICRFGNTPAEAGKTP